MSNASTPRLRANRKPLREVGPTKRMVRTIRAAANRSDGKVSLALASVNGVKAFTKSLVDRGLIESDGRGSYVITDGGRTLVAYLAAQQ